ncbi:Ger(x)C family spore germination protein [Paenibacillus sp. R14(2021)]|uniref:Ger(x)C family spore germination protein n=1 Tax=Paenibacillus sp. R14(2021) TaxID=2859228 RepID=UPI001C613081|nr:Ger(x)C family spore germination protein [Paenibacillus sp. R14(2021)]
MKKYVPLLFCCFLLSGCAKEQIVDRIKLIQSVGNDLQGDTIKVSATYLAFEKKARLLLLEGKSKSFNEAFTPFASQTDHPIAIGQLQTLVINEKLARRGISDLASSIVRDPLISNRSTLVLTTGQASDILAETLKYPPAYLSNLIKQNMENENTPITNGHVFLDQYFGAGQDVFLPILIKDSKGILQMDGVGVFHGDQLKLLLTNKRGLFIKLLKEDKVEIHASRYTFKNDQNELISFKIIYSKPKITIQNEKAFISMKLDIDLGDYPATLNVFENNNDMLEVKKQIENHFTTEIKAMLEYFQTNHVDPIGIGSLDRTRHRDWNEQKFYARIYPKLKFDVRTQVKILSLGVGH